jgi:hypothetical protein
LENGGAIPEIQENSANSENSHNYNSNINSNKNSKENTNNGYSDFSSEIEPHPPDLGSRIQSRIKTWNDLEIKPPCRKTALNLVNSSLPQIAITFQHYSDVEIDGAMGNYAKILKEPEKFFAPRYMSFESFLEKGVEKFADDAAPFETLLSRCQGPPKKTEESESYWDDIAKRALESSDREVGDG